MNELTIARVRERSEAREAIKSCTACDALSAAAEAPVPWHGPAPGQMLFVVDVPTPTDDKAGRLLAGKLEDWLRSVFVRVGLDWGAVSVTSTIHCRADRKPTDHEVMMCLSHFRTTLRLVDPSVVVVAGAGPLRLASTRAKISRCHGRPFMGHTGPLIDRLVFPMMAPTSAFKVRRTRDAFYGDVSVLASIVLGHRDWTEVGAHVHQIPV
jgi:uracil-DNA glycosylase family 4